MEKVKEKQFILAVFDFDGTIINRDSLPDFLIQTFGFSSFLLRLPWIVGMKVAAIFGILSVGEAKARVISSFIRNMRKDDFLAACYSYALRIPQIVYPAALQKIREHQLAGHKVIIISASIADWIRPWADAVGISNVEATEVEVKKGLLTGCFSTPNCKGPEKVRRLLLLYPDIRYYTLYAYGDSAGDKEMLALADYAFYKPFTSE